MCRIGLYRSFDESCVAAVALVKTATISQFDCPVANKVTAAARDKTGRATIGTRKAAPIVFISVVRDDGERRIGGILRRRRLAPDGRLCQGQPTGARSASLQDDPRLACNSCDSDCGTGFFPRETPDFNYLAFLLGPDSRTLRAIASLSSLVRTSTKAVMTRDNGRCA